ncbi:thaumatin family protein [Nannocystis pusilla]|uniref:thaumatin family protein n=1 Tax=Nannocystis pusilla TaxID=889268 RepID=UPI003BF26C46
MRSDSWFIFALVLGCGSPGTQTSNASETAAETGSDTQATSAPTASTSNTAPEPEPTTSTGTQTASTSVATETASTSTGAQTASTSETTGEPLPEQTARLRIVNGCDQPMWVLHQVGAGGGTLDAANQILLAAQGDYYDYAIPDIGLAATRFWPGFGCDETGNGCAIGQSGGPPEQGFTCPPEGCAPPIDSKFEGTFGCLPGVAPNDCQDNPSAPGMKLPASDGWDTSMVDGFTVPYEVELLDDCPGGPQGGAIDCSELRLSDCPTAEDISTNQQFPALSAVDLRADHPTTQEPGGCYSPCGKLTYANWGNAPVYAPADAEAEYYCCPTPPIDVEACRQGPVVDTQFVGLIHDKCKQVYSYAYDDGIGNWSCPAGTRYRVTFYCPQ